MVYEGTQSLDYVKNYADATSQWEGYPITVDVPTSDILLGCKAVLSRIIQMSIQCSTQNFKYLLKFNFTIPDKAGARGRRVLVTS